LFCFCVQAIGIYLPYCDSPTFRFQREAVETNQRFDFIVFLKLLSQKEVDKKLRIGII